MTLSEKEYFVLGESWQKLKLNAVILPAKESWAPLKSYLIKMCKQYGNCQKEISLWERKVKAIDEKAGVK